MNRHGHSRTTTFTATCMGPEMGGPHSTQVVTAPPDSIQAENILTSPQLVLEHGFDLNNTSLLSFLRNEIYKTIGDEGITVDFWIIKVHTSN